MILAGNFIIKNDRVYAVWRGKPVLPYYIIDRKFASFSPQTPFTLTALDSKRPYVLNGITPTEHDDDFVLWFAAAPDESYRIDRSLCRHAVVLNVHINGALAVAIASRRTADRQSSLVFVSSLPNRTSAVYVCNA